MFTARFGLEPMEPRSVWHAQTLRSRDGTMSFLHFACAMGLGHLRSEHRNFVAGFRLGIDDMYAHVRAAAASSSP